MDYDVTFITGKSVSRSIHGRNELTVANKVARHLGNKHNPLTVRQSDKPNTFILVETDGTVYEVLHVTLVW